MAQVVITEIMYHPASDERREEYIEIVNAGPDRVDCTGWRITEGVTFAFTEGTVLDPGELLVVAADPHYLSQTRNHISRAVTGPWNGSLSNRGETITLVDPEGTVIDSVSYSDEPPWPTAPDGEGPSLECINPRMPNDTARNWAASEPKWLHVTYTGTATSSKLLFYLTGPGACLLDDVTLAPENGGPSRVPNGSFERGGEAWTARGSSRGSAFLPEGGRGGSGCLKIVASAPGTGASDGISCYADPPLERGAVYRLSFYVLHLEGAFALVSRLSGGGLFQETQVAPGNGTPGMPNSRAQEVLPPLVTSVEIEPPVPLPAVRPVARAHVEEDGPSEVTLLYYHRGSGELVLRDDGTAPDERAGDHIYCGFLPSFDPGSVVWVTVRAEQDQRTSRPFQTGFGVAEEPVRTQLPVLWIFVEPESWRYLNENLWTDRYVPALLVAGGKAYPQVGLRFRGGRPRFFQKKSLKLRFSHSRFEGRRVLNLNAAAMDDDYMTEPLAYDFYASCGVPASETEWVRVQLNGSFWGLFISVEQVDEDYLRQRDLHPEGVLYKAVGIASNLSDLGGTGYTYQGQYEKKTRTHEPYDDLIGFIEGLSRTEQPEQYLERNLRVEVFARYLAATNLMCVWDAIQHNYYLYRPPGGKWLVIPWDLDHAWGEWEWVYYWGDTYPLLMGHQDYPFAGAWYAWNKLWTVFFDVPRFRAMYEEYIREFLNTTFTEWALFPQIEKYRARIEQTVLLDEAKWPDSSEPAHSGPARTMAEELPLLMQNIARRRRYVAGLLGVELSEEPPVRFLRGDANADGVRDVADAVATLGYLFSGTALPCLSACDSNDDGAVDIGDAVALLAFLFAGRTQLPEPFSGCGGDQTPDELSCNTFEPCRKKRAQ